MGGSRLHSMQNGGAVAAPRDQHGQRNGGDRKQDRGPGCGFGQQIGCTTRAECRLGALSAKRTGQISSFTWLQQDNADENETNQYVNHC